MKKFFSLCSPLCLTSLCAGLLGCMGVPMTNESSLQNPFTPHECWGSGVIADGQNSQIDIQ